MGGGGGSISDTPPRPAELTTKTPATTARSPFTPGGTTTPAPATGTNSPPTTLTPPPTMPGMDPAMRTKLEEHYRNTGQSLPDNWGQITGGGTTPTTPAYTPPAGRSFGDRSYGPAGPATRVAPVAPTVTPPATGEVNGGILGNKEWPAGFGPNAPTSPGVTTEPWTKQSPEGEYMSGQLNTMPQWLKDQMGMSGGYGTPAEIQRLRGY